MSDLTMAKVKALYQDMVLIEQNMVELDRKAELRVAMLDKRATFNRGQNEVQSSLGNTLKTIVMSASVAFSLGLALSSDSDFKILLICIPVGLAIAWGIATHLERRRTTIEHKDPVPLSTSPVVKGCSREDFIQRCLDARIEGRDKEACEDVLFGNLSVEDAARKHKLFPTTLTARLTKIDMQQCQQKQ